MIVGVAVTLTLAATLFASWAWGFTLNRVSLFALIFSIGILVDDAIVVVENIHRWQALHPEKSLVEIIPAAVDEVGGPTILATLTVIAALLPMAFVTGLMGPYMSPIPINSSMGMLISLAIAFVVTPWLALKLMRPASAAHSHQPSKLDLRLERTFRTLLTPFLDPLKGGAARAKLGIAVVLLILGSVSLAYFQLVVLKMLPFDNKSEFQIILDMPVGTPVEETARVLHEIGTNCADARSDQLPGLRRHRQPDQLQRPGAPVLPARRAGNGRHPGQSGRQAPAFAQEPRDRRLGARPRRGDRQEERRQRQGRRSAAGAAGDVADRRRSLRSRL